MRLLVWFSVSGGSGEAEECQSTCAALERPAEPPDDAHHSCRYSRLCSLQTFTTVIIILFVFSCLQTYVLIGPQSGWRIDYYHAARVPKRRERWPATSLSLNTRPEPSMTAGHKTTTRRHWKSRWRAPTCPTNRTSRKENPMDSCDQKMITLFV